MVLDVAAALKIMKGLGTGTSLLKRVDPAEIRRTLFETAAEDEQRDMVQVAYAVSAAFVAQLLGSEMGEDDVWAFMDRAKRDVAFPGRMRRLIGEARKAPSERRRVYLASVLFGLPLTGVSHEHRDRVDMLMERLLPEDVDLLKRIADCQSQVEQPRRPGSFSVVGAFSVQIGGEMRIVPGTHKFLTDDVGFSPDPVAFGSLETHGCIATSRASMAEDVEIGNAHFDADDVRVTPLGHLLLKALDDVRAGLEAKPPSSADGPPARSQGGSP